MTGRPFLDELRVAQPNPASPTWRLTAPFSFEVPGRRGVVMIPEGFETDGASVPRVLWMVFPPAGDLLWPAVVHDFLYACLLAGTPHPSGRTRQAADAVFREAAIVAGISRPAAWAVWAGVRAFGSRRASRARLPAPLPGAV